MTGPLIFQIILGVIAANIVTLLGVYSIAQMNRTQLALGQASVRSILMWLACLAIIGLILFAALG